MALMESNIKRRRGRKRGGLLVEEAQFHWAIWKVGNHERKRQHMSNVKSQKYLDIPSDFPISLATTGLLY
jgi:hypothetical protein